MHVLQSRGRLLKILINDEFRPKGGIYPPELFEALGTTFGFIIPPQLDRVAEEGFRFRQGKATIDGRSFLVNEVGLMNEGILVDVESNTDDAEVVLERISDLLAELGANVLASSPGIFHMSILVFDFSKTINSLVDGFAELTSLVARFLPISVTPDLAAIVLRSDPFTLPPRLFGLNPTGFKLERRVGVEHSVNRYFSEAQVRTADHLKILEAIERRL